jgi:hypothetical protein
MYAIVKIFGCTHHLFTSQKIVVVKCRCFSNSKMRMQVKMTLEKVRVSIATNPHILLIDSAHTFTLNGKAVVRVEAPSSMKNHAPIDLVTLININQSMSWPAASQTEIPSRLDLLKNAMKFIIRQLGDDDRLAIVAFNDKVIKENTTGILEISGSGRMAIEKKVDGLVAMGDTAFKPSLEHAVKVCGELSYSI